MAAATTIIAGIGVGLAAGSAAMSYRGYRDARSQGDKAAMQEWEATQERIRRLGIERDAIVGAQTAGAAAANVDVGSASVRELQAETVREYDTQIAFTRRAGAFAAEAAELQGRTVAYQNLGQGLQSLQSAVRIASDAGLFGTK